VRCSQELADSLLARKALANARARRKRSPDLVRSERGAWFALDLGGTNFRVLRLTLSDEARSVADVKARDTPRAP